ncbi:hypothetical protein [Parvimonas micra]|uniref:hypothetical protein n=1 Tax=Parvimonas micra TaxID=33033 RepID=UPI001475E836|nr:hypothetical protein [Parvimonas micra]
MLYYSSFAISFLLEYGRYTMIIVHQYFIVYTRIEELKYLQVVYIREKDITIIVPII